MVTADLIAPLITENTRAIYVLHKGAPAEIEDIYSLGESCGVKVIEDLLMPLGQAGGKNIGTTEFMLFFISSDQTYHYR